MFKESVDNIVIHNTYNYKLLDKDNNIILEKTEYNTADSGIYIAEIGTNKTSYTTLNILYHPYDKTVDNERQYQTSYATRSKQLKFTKVSNDNSGENTYRASYVSYAEYTTSECIGKIVQLSLGPAVTIDGTTCHWSEVSKEIEKTETQRLLLTITINITINLVLNSGVKYYKKELSSLLNVSGGYFPTPAPFNISLSTVDISNINGKLNKIVPTVLNLPTTTVRKYYDNTVEPQSNTGYYLIKNPTSNYSNDNEYYLSDTENSYSIGYACTLVYKDIGAISLSNENNGEVEYILLELTQSEIEQLRNNNNTNNFNFYYDEVNEDYYYFCSIPIGCRVSGLVSINGTAQNEITFENPNSIRERMNNEIIDDSSIVLKDEDKGTYYANYLFGANNDYWIPASGKGICPQTISLNSMPTHIYTGQNISCSIYGFDGIKTVKFLTSQRYKMVTKVDDVSYTDCYAEISVPDTDNLNYFVTKREESNFYRKSYDPLVLCIGDDSCDFRMTGLKIPKNSLNNLVGSTKVVFKVKIITSNYYKANDTIAYLKYGMKAKVS